VIDYCVDEKEEYDMGVGIEQLQKILSCMK